MIMIVCNCAITINCAYLSKKAWIKEASRTVKYQWNVDNKNNDSNTLQFLTMECYNADTQCVIGLVMYRVKSSVCDTIVIAI